MVEQNLRLSTVNKEKKNAFLMADCSQMLPVPKLFEIPDLISMEQEISYQIAQQLLSYYEERPNLGFSEEMITRMILKSVTFAGMFAAYEYEESIEEDVEAESIVCKLAEPNMGNILVNVQNRLEMDAAEGVFLFRRIDKIADVIFNDFYRIYHMTSNPFNDSFVLTDTMTVLFSLGMGYAIHRMNGRIGSITETDAWKDFKLEK